MTPDDEFKSMADRFFCLAAREKIAAELAEARRQRDAEREASREYLRQRDEWKARAEKAEQAIERLADEWRAKADRAEMEGRYWES